MGGGTVARHLDKICILIIFLAKWLSQSFNRKILRKKERGRKPSCPLIFDYLKRRLELVIVLQTFSLIKNIRNLRINLRNELLYSYIFIAYMREFTLRRYLALYTKAYTLSQFLKNDR